MNFRAFKAAVTFHYEQMQKKHPLFRVDVDKDKLWDTYLNSFPEGSNPHYRERTEHDCSCCKQFIRAIGDVVAIVDDKMISIWDIAIPNEPEYQVVGDAMAKLIYKHNIANVFRHFERTAGTDKNFEELTTGVKTWDHFFVNIDGRYVAKNADIPTVLAKPRESAQMFLQAVSEISTDAIETVLDLIAQNSLYRGADYLFMVNEFKVLRAKAIKLKGEALTVFGWTAATSNVSESVLRIRGSVIGTLLTDLSSGKEVDYAVTSFETKVAPQNYKRPTALITPAMKEKAKQKIEELGLLSALDRRYATINDITINNILFANRESKKIMDASVFDDLEVSNPKIKSMDKVETITIGDFIDKVLPRVESIEVLFENKHATKLVTLVAPVDATAGRLFKWENNFSWSYNGEMADSIKERVKKAGGSVVGDLCCRLAWDYKDDLDFHMKEPGGEHIHFATRWSASGGHLDLDANGMDGMKEFPAENIFYADKKKMKEGIYTLSVNNYSRRSEGRGFTVEVEYEGQTLTFNYEGVLRGQQSMLVAKIKYSKTEGFSIVESMPSSVSSKTVWNIPTQAFHKVNVMMLSPNYWDGNNDLPGFAGSTGVGNKHYFFMLDKCLNDTTARGFFNEFLKEELNVHRKVFEVVGSKMKLDESNQQLSGLGFSYTQKDELVCRVKGSFSRLLKVVF